MEQEVELIKKYLDEEEEFIKEDTTKEKKITEEELRKLDELMRKGKKEDEHPLIQKTEELKKHIEEVEDLKRRGRQGEDKANLLDDLEGPKHGIKITVNNVFDLMNYNALKIEISVFLEEKKLFDEFGNPCDYLLPIIDDHVPDDATLLKLNRRKKLKRIDVEVIEVQYVVKDLVGILKLFENTKHIYLVFQIYEVKDEGGILEYPNSYKVYEKRNRIGWVIFQATNGEFLLKEGRYKNQICRLPVRKPPLDPSKKINYTKSYIDFTIQIFEYTTADNSLFAFRRRKKRKEPKQIFKIDERPFIPNSEQQWLDIPFQKGSGVDLYVDCARYLPNTCTVTKILVRIVDSNLRDIKKPTTRVANFESQALMPQFNCRIELRLPFFNPTLMAVITIMTVDEKDDEGKPSIVGYTFFPLFVDRNTHQQPEDQSNKVDYLLILELCFEEWGLSNANILSELF